MCWKISFFRWAEFIEKKRQCSMISRTTSNNLSVSHSWNTLRCKSDMLRVPFSKYSTYLFAFVIISILTHSSKVRYFLRISWVQRLDPRIKSVPNLRFSGMRREDLAVHVRREHVFEDSFRELHRRSADEWKHRFYIIFEGRISSLPAGCFFRGKNLKV